jgi:hypothetical protein
MKNNIKLMISIISIFLIVGVSFYYCKPLGDVLTPVNQPPKDEPESATPSLSQAKVKQTTPMSAFLSAFETPISLFGKVVDQHDDPVPGASVKLSPISKPFSDGSGEGPTLVTDANGNFSIQGLRGFSMGVSARKDDGYLYLSPLGGPASSAMVSYDDDAADGKRYSNPATPITLTLHKIGTTEPLLSMEDTRWKLPIDNKVSASPWIQNKHLVHIRLNFGSIQNG